MLDEQVCLHTALALSLYAYHEPPTTRAQRLHAYFAGDLALEEVLAIMNFCKGYEMIKLPFNAAEVYVEQALEHYGDQADSLIHQNTGLKFW